MASTYHCLKVHIVYATKGRVPLIGSDWRGELHAYLGGTVRGLGAFPIAVGGVEDHVHLLVGMKATSCVSDLVRETKKSSSIWASQRYGPFGWQVGYSAFSVGIREASRVAAYIRSQEEHHRESSFSDELRGLLAEHGIEIDERFFE